MSFLPTELNYLEPVAKELAKLPPEELNEDIDLTAIEAAFRERVKGLNLPEAIRRLTEDGAIAKRWLSESKITSGVEFWLVGLLMRPGLLARRLLAPVSPPGPAVSVEVPEGWNTKSFPARLDLSKEKLTCSITILDEAGFERRKGDSRRKLELQKGPNNPWAIHQGVWSKSQANFGECRGEKIVYAQKGKVNWKRIDYLLEVPGGFVNAFVAHLEGADFGESEIETRLHTLKIISPAAASSDVAN